MIWHVFKSNLYSNNPRNPGEYLGSIDIPEKMEKGIDINIQKFDLHLRATRRKAYSENYNRVLPKFEMRKYGGFIL